MTTARPLRQLAAVLGAADGGHIDVPELRDGKDWDPVLECAGRTALMPALWSASRRLGLLEPVPDDLLELLGRSAERRHAAAVLQLAHRANGERNADLMAQLDDASALLAEAGIPMVALKGGGHLARGLWPDLADRAMADLDLLVPADAAAEAQSTLLAAGYEVAPGAPGSAEKHHLEAVHRPGRFGSIELHSEPLSRGYTDGLRGAEVIAAACPVADRPRLRVPSPVHTAAIALVHAYLADECWLDRIIPLRNVHELWRLDTHETIDWSEVHGLLRRIGRGRLVAEQLVNASRLFGAREPANTVASARAQVRFRTYEPTVRRVMAPMDKVASAIDPGRLRSYYGAQIGGPWRLRAHHLRRALRRRVR